MLEVYDYVMFQLKKIFKNSDIELYEFTLLTAALVHVLFSGKELLLYFLYYVLVHFSETYFICQCRSLEAFMKII